jgi:hypothetical protein
VAYFSTGLISIDWMEFRERRFCGRGWSVCYRDCPDSQTTIGGRKGHKRYTDKELVIEADTEERALQCFELILAAWNAIHVLPFVIGSKYQLSQITSRHQKARETDFTNRTTTKTSGFPIVLRLSCKASRRWKLQYAIVKLYLSVWHCCVHDIDYAERDYVGITSSSFSHVSLAAGLFLAYSAIEELGLEPRGASNQRPLIKKNVWHTELRHELETRLKKAGINLGETLLWMKRHKPTRISRIATPPGTGAKWGFGPMRDEEVSIVEAIPVASRLRSRITAHGLPDIARSLTVYDVGNVQQLTRRLILESCGLWGRN